MLYIILIASLLLATTQLAVADAATDPDRLEPALRKMSAPQRLDTLETLVLDIKNRDNKLYPERLLKEARQAHDKDREGTALLKLAEYYYTRNIDSLHLYITLAEPIMLAQERFHEALRMRGWYIYALSNSGENDKVLEEIDKMKELANATNQLEGIDMANQCLADFYLKTNLGKEGNALYEQIFDDMVKRDAPLIRRYQIIRQLLNNNIDNEKKEHYLNILNEYIADCESKGITRLDENTPLVYVKYIYARSMSLLSINKGDAEQTLHYIRQTERIVEQAGITSERNTLLSLRLEYYTLVGDYTTGNPLANQLLQTYLKTKRHTYALNIIKKKALLCKRSGHFEEAAETYTQYIQLNDSINNADYHQAMAKMRSRHDIDRLELRDKEQEVEIMRSRNIILSLVGGVFLLTLSCVLLYYIFHTQKRKNQIIRKAKNIAEEGRRRAEEADQMKSSFLANMNHEIRTPLNAIVGFSQVLIAEEDPDVREQYAQIIMDNNELLQRLIADVLDLSKIESNSLQITYKRQDLPNLMNGIYNVILLRMPPGVELRMDPPEPLEMDTDRNRLTQILTNLLTNAAKHTTEGYIRFGYRRKDDSVEFFVQDTGEGIPDDKIGSIFSRFVKLDNWSTGVGLGLAISQGLVERMGGKIWVTSKLGEGSVFYVSLPITHPSIQTSN